MMFLAALSLAACGGGGGGGPLPASVFVGQYSIAFIALEDDRDMEVAWGTGNADGQSLLSITGSENDNGTVTSPPDQSLEFAISADGTMTVGQGGSTFLSGAVRPDGGIAVLNSIDPSQPGIAVLIRRSGTYSAATATGLYGLSSFGSERMTPVVTTIFGTATFDGASATQWSVGLNIEGTTSGGAGLTASYTIAPDGTSTLATASYAYEGAWVPGGDLGFVGGDTIGEPTASGSDPFLFVFARRSSGLDDADFAGTYRIVGIEYNATATIASSFFGTLTSDSMGGLSISGTQNAGGMVEAFGGTGSYSVAGDGAVELDRTGRVEKIQGTISPDGRYFIASGASETDSDPVLWIAFRD
ncbi:MAG: hypothetical protein QNJ98_08615 [Planctomycetota bacterium]|nr:hypothetical protein [Planctomycetota bacterium]